MQLLDIFESRCPVKCSGNQFVWSKRNNQDMQKRVEKRAENEIKKRTRIAMKDNDNG
jgi:hypothetical protein